MDLMNVLKVGSSEFEIADAEAREELETVNESLETKAEIDGAYESMTVGNAEQLIATTYTEDQVPYNFRTSGGSADIGNRETDMIVGGTIAWNQLGHDTLENEYSKTITNKYDLTSLSDKK